MLKMLEKLDLKDRRLLAELDANSRASLSELAKKIRLSREAVNYRIKRLQKRGIIKGFVTQIDYTKLGYEIYVVYFKFDIVNEKKEKEVVEYLRKLPNINWVASLGGRFDFMIEFPARNIQDFRKRYAEIISKYPGVFVEQEVVINTFQQRLNRGYLYPIKQKIEKKGDIEKEKIQINKGDKEIIEILKKNSRTPLIEIAKKTTLPASTVAKRIKNLKKKGVIRDFALHVDPRKYGYQNFKFCIRMAEFSEKIDSMIRTYVEENLNTVYYINGVGRWDYEINFDVENHEKYRREIRQLRNLLGKHMAYQETLEIFTAYKFTY